MAALTQLRCTALEVADPLSKAVAHRLGVELASVRDPGIIYSGSASVYSTSGTVRVPSSLIALHTVAAQLRLFLSREPDLASMRQVIDSES